MPLAFYVIVDAQNFRQPRTITTMHIRRIILLAALILWPLPVLAHPHIFVRYDVVIASAESGFVKLHFTFKIRALANPLLTPGAQAADKPLMQRDMLANLAAHPFFIYLDMDQQSIGRQMVRPSAAAQDGNDQIFVFDLTLPDSVRSFSFALYDPDYFDSVWQTGADSVHVSWDKIACRTAEQEVGKTMWGILRAQIVQCGDKTAALPPLRSFKNQPMYALPSGGNNFTGGRQMVP